MEKDIIRALAYLKNAEDSDSDPNELHRSVENAISALHCMHGIMLELRLRHRVQLIKNPELPLCQCDFMSLLD